MQPVTNSHPLGCEALTPALREFRDAFHRQASIQQRRLEAFTWRRWVPFEVRTLVTSVGLSFPQIELKPWFLNENYVAGTHRYRYIDDYTSPSISRKTPFQTSPTRLLLAHERLIRHLQRTYPLNRPLRIVDIGIGRDGAPSVFSFAQLLQEAGFTNVELIGVDNQEVNVEEAKTRLEYERPLMGIDLSFRYGDFDLSKLGLHDLDVITTANTMMHYTPAQQTQQKDMIVSALKPTGWMVFIHGPDWVSESHQLEISILNRQEELVDTVSFIVVANASDRGVVKEDLTGIEPNQEDPTVAHTRAWHAQARQTAEIFQAVGILKSDIHAAVASLSFGKFLEDFLAARLFQINPDLMTRLSQKRILDKFLRSVAQHFLPSDLSSRSLSTAA